MIRSQNNTLWNVKVYSYSVNEFMGNSYLTYLYSFSLRDEQWCIHTFVLHINTSLYFRRRKISFWITDELCVYNCTLRQEPEPAFHFHTLISFHIYISLIFMSFFGFFARTSIFKLVGVVNASEVTYNEWVALLIP